jgi:hypothetical protein
MELERNLNCNAHPEYQISLYCICGNKLCVSCLDIHYHENLAFYDINMLTKITSAEIEQMATLIKELEEYLSKNNQLEKEKIVVFKEIKNKIVNFKNEENRRPEELIEFIKENYKARLEELTIHAYYDSMVSQKKLEKFIQRQKRKERKLEKKLKIRKIELKRNIESDCQVYAPSPQKIYYSSSKVNRSRSGIFTSNYGSSYEIKVKKPDNLYVSNFNITLTDSSFESIEDAYDMNTGNNNNQIVAKLEEPVPIEPVSVAVTVPVKKENDNGRKLSVCENCNCYFILSVDQNTNLCSKCRKNGQQGIKEKVKLVCVNCRDNFSVERNEENMNRTKCDICIYNNKLN